MFRVSRLARACFGQSARPLMAFFAYLDCSGSSRDPQAKVLTVAGYIAHEDVWADFERQWTEVLRAFGVDALHMKEYAHSTSQFASWKGDEPKRRAFMAALTDVINGCDLHSVSATMLRDGYEAANDLYRIREELGPPYAIATLKAVAHTFSWHKRRGFEEPLMVVIEKGDNDQSSFNQALDRLTQHYVDDLVTRPIFQKKKWENAKGEHVYCVPFQAADFIAYEHAKMFTDHIVSGKRKVRESLFRVSYPWKGDDDMSQFMTGEGIVTMATIVSVGKRFNRPAAGVAGSLPLEPLCYVSIDQPLAADISVEGWSQSAPLFELVAACLVR